MIDTSEPNTTILEIRSLNKEYDVETQQEYKEISQFKKDFEQIGNMEKLYSLSDKLNLVNLQIFLWYLQQEITFISNQRYLLSIAERQGNFPKFSFKDFIAKLKADKLKRE